MPILRCVKLVAQDGRITVTGSDIETFVQTFCKAKVQSQGTICVPAGELADSLKALATESPTVTMAIFRSKTTLPMTSAEYEEAKKNAAPGTEVPSTKPGWRHEFRIEAGNTSATIPTYDSKDYPPVPKLKPTAVIQFRNLVSAIGEVDYALAHHDSRPALTGLDLKQVNGHIALTAADGFRLATVLVKARGKAPDELIIPGGTVEVIKKLLPEDTRLDIQEYKKNNAAPEDKRQKLHCLCFRDKKGLVTVTANAVDSTYPQYEQLIPKNRKKLTVAKAVMEQALRVMATLKEDVPVRLQKKGGNLVISRGNSERELVSKVPAKGAIKVGADIGYLQDMVRRLDGDITLRSKDATSPILAKQGATTHVLMPRQVQW